jgi:hypothetical protein
MEQHVGKCTPLLRMAHLNAVWELCFVAFRRGSTLAASGRSLGSADPKEITVTSPQTRLSPLEVTESAACMCDHGFACSSFAPGHALHLIQARLASATPLGWTDALVEAADAASGVLDLRTLDGESITVWNAGGAALEAAVGTPVALHRDYHVLAVGSVQYNVAR